jgi:hypothetical protein
MAIKAKLNTFDATMIVVSLIIGVGIFRTPAMGFLNVTLMQIPRFTTPWPRTGPCRPLRAGRPDRRNDRCRVGVPLFPV